VTRRQFHAVIAHGTAQCAQHGVAGAIGRRGIEFIELDADRRRIEAPAAAHQREQRRCGPLLGHRFDIGEHRGALPSAVAQKYRLQARLDQPEDGQGAAQNLWPRGHALHALREKPRRSVHGLAQRLDATALVDRLDRLSRFGLWLRSLGECRRRLDDRREGKRCDETESRFARSQWAHCLHP
jgi:hypothetical protein